MNPICRECSEGELDCYIDQDEACSDCGPPTVYKCDKTDLMNPICKECSEGELECYLN